jgi:hypothetical protein
MKMHSVPVFIVWQTMVITSLSKLEYKKTRLRTAKRALIGLERSYVTTSSLIVKIFFME